MEYVREVRRKLEDLEMKIETIQGALDFTQNSFTKFATQNQDRIDKELGVQGERLLAISRRLTEIEIELGMATPLKRLKTSEWMQPIKYNDPIEPTILKEEEI